MSGFRWQDPMWLLCAVVVALIVWASDRRSRRDAISFSSVSLLRGLPVTFALRIKRVLPWVRGLGLMLVVLALARPQRGLQEFRVRTEGIAVQMCLDRSGSMQAMDFQLDGKRTNRLTAVKKVFRDFVVGGSNLVGRPDDLIGLVAFGGFAEAKAPLTLDHGALLQVLDSVEIPKPVTDSRGRVLNQQLYQEEMATAIGDAVVTAVERLKDVTAKSKVIILLSDGEQTAGIADPQQAADVARTHGVKIYSIGVGSTGPAPFPAVDRFGREVLVRQDVRLDAETLTAIAESTGGKYFHAENTKALEDVYAEIDRLEKTLTEGRLYTEYRELYSWFLLPGITLVFGECLLSATRFRSLP